MSKKNTAPAKKLNLGAIIPVALLLIGLVIMTVCFFNVNSQLNETRAALADAQTRVAALEGAEAPVDADVADVVVTDDAAVIAALEAELAAANDAIVALEAELAAANTAIAEKDELLTLANDAISQATAALEAIYGTAAEEPAEVVEEPAEVVEEPAEAVEEPAEVVEEPAEVVEEPAEVAEESAEVAEEPAEAVEEAPAE